jgi:hypothetical protein
MVPAGEYERLKRRDKKVMSIEETPDWLAELVMSIDMDPRHDKLIRVRAPECLSNGPFHNRVF